MDRQSGTYALILVSSSDKRLAIGRLGELQLQPGFYLYAGSAHGPGGLRSRIAHHLTPSPRPHWHIDYLRRFTDPLEAWITQDPRRREHDWARLLDEDRQASVPLRGFGASDCSCPTHLFFFPARPSIRTFRRRLQTALPGHAPVGRHPVSENGITVCSRPVTLAEAEERGEPAEAGQTSPRKTVKRSKS
jgi:Uri superfamily endonuclease